MLNPEVGDLGPERDLSNFTSAIGWPRDNITKTTVYWYDHHMKVTHDPEAGWTIWVWALTEGLRWQHKMLNVQTKVRRLPQLFLLRVRNLTVDNERTPFIHLFNKYLLNIVLSQCPGKQSLGRDLCQGGLLRITLENNLCKGLRETELTRKGGTEMNLPHRP